MHAEDVPVGLMGWLVLVEVRCCGGGGRVTLRGLGGCRGVERWKGVRGIG